MRTIPSALQDKLDGGVTTLAHCWLITRNDGVVQGFTDHDRDIVLDGVTCRAGSGLDASEVTQNFGSAVDTSEFSGALADDSLNEDDLAAGRYDGAAVALWLVDWSEPALRVLLAKGTLGEVKREGPAFTAELRGLSQQLAENTGRLYATACSADVGDARCKVDLTNVVYFAIGTVVTVNATSSIAVSGIDDFNDGWFTGGKLTFTSGANNGLAVEVKTHSKGDTITLNLWQAMPQAIAEGDGFTLTAGCDKQFATRRNKFANVANFRGFPHIPGNDFVISYPVAGDAKNDGSSRQS